MALNTIKEVAEKCGVSKQAISAYLRRNNLTKQLTKDGNKLLINDNIRQQIEMHFVENRQKSEKESTTFDKKEQQTTTNDNAQIEPEPAPVPWAVYEDLRQQLEIKDKQIEDLSKALLNAQEQGQAAQLLHAADRKEDLILESQEQKEEHKTRWQRLKEAWRG